MKPRNKIEQEVVNLSHKLGEIGKRDNARLIRNTYGSCKYEDMYNRCYAVINQSYKGWQVLRYFRIDRHGKRDISYSTWEVFQLWNKVGEKHILIARQRAYHYYVDAFLLSSPMEIRQNPKYCASWLHFTDVGFSYMYDKSVDSTYKYCDSLIPTNERKTKAEHEEEIQRIKRAMDKNEKYIKARSCFFDMTISDNLITCHVLQSVDEFYEEGTAMHHCVYANRYYEKQNSLILSARINDKRIETVEVDLKQMKVVQCYGACDKFTLYHDRIVNLVNNNMNMIKQCLTSKQIAI